MNFRVIKEESARKEIMNGEKKKRHCISPWLLHILLTTEEAHHLLEETADISVGPKPTLHELLDRVDEILESLSRGARD